MIPADPLAQEIVSKLDAVPLIDTCECGRPKSEHTFWDDKIYDVQGYKCPGYGRFDGEYRFSPTLTAVRHREAKVAVAEEFLDALAQEKGPR